jgi:hypothetical protein
MTEADIWRGLALMASLIGVLGLSGWWSERRAAERKEEPTRQ